jgi:hypothetical protein
MKSKPSPKKQPVALKDLNAKKNPKGGFPVGASLGTKTAISPLTLTGKSS